jgi:putative NADPH-quinone reductase
MLYFTGMQVLPPYISYSPARITDEERVLEIEKYKKYLEGIESLASIY